MQHNASDDLESGRWQSISVEGMGSLHKRASLFAIPFSKSSTNDWSNKILRGHGKNLKFSFDHRGEKKREISADYSYDISIIETVHSKISNQSVFFSSHLCWWT